MLSVNFFTKEEVEDDLFKFAVIAARYNGKWIFCRHKERSTWEIPGGHREPGEDIAETAKRELYEEAGAEDAVIRPIAAYCVTNKAESTYGMLFYADVKRLGELPADTEIAEIILSDILPDNLTYPQIQPYLYTRILDWLAE